MMRQIAVLTVALGIALRPDLCFAAGAPDLFGITPGMDLATASKQALAQIHPSKFVNMKFSTGQPAGFQAITDGHGGRSEGFRVDTPVSGVVTFLSRAVDFGSDVGPQTDDLLRDLEAKYGRYSSRETIGTGLAVLVWRYSKDWQIQGTAPKECAAITLKTDISGTLPLYLPPDKARACDPFMRVSIQSNPDTKAVKSYSIAIFDERRMFAETNQATTTTVAAH